MLAVGDSELDVGGINSTRSLLRKLPRNEHAVTGSVRIFS